MTSAQKTNTDSNLFVFLCCVCRDVFRVNISHKVKDIKAFINYRDCHECSMNTSTLKINGFIMEEGGVKGRGSPVDRLEVLMFAELQLSEEVNTDFCRENNRIITSQDTLDLKSL